MACAIPVVYLGFLHRATGEGNPRVHTGMPCHGVPAWIRVLSENSTVSHAVTPHHDDLTLRVVIMVSLCVVPFLTTHSENTHHYDLVEWQMLRPS